MKRLQELIKEWDDPKDIEKLLDETRGFTHYLWGTIHEASKMMHQDKDRDTSSAHLYMYNKEIQDRISVRYKKITHAEAKLKEIFETVGKLHNFLLTEITAANAFEIKNMLTDLNSQIENEDDLFLKIRENIAIEIKRFIRYLHIIETEGKHMDTIRKSLDDLR